jgi:hypothetical protein
LRAICRKDMGLSFEISGNFGESGAPGSVWKRAPG